MSYRSCSFLLGEHIFFNKIEDIYFFILRQILYLKPIHHNLPFRERISNQRFCAQSSPHPSTTISFDHNNVHLSANSTRTVLMTINAGRDVPIGRCGLEVEVYEWIERLLAAPIRDGRKTAISLALAPYLVKLKGLRPDEASRTINIWLDECTRVRPVDSKARYLASYMPRGVKCGDKEQQSNIQTISYRSLV